jgi:protein phosphatase
LNEHAQVTDETPPPYDLIGDVHGCINELRELLDALGYVAENRGGVWHPDGRTLIFLGDLADRGPGGLEVWRLVLGSLEHGIARFVPGNHDSKLARYLEGRDVRISHGFEQTVRELAALPAAERALLADVIHRTVLDAPPYLLLDQGRLGAAHAGVEEWMVGGNSRQISIFARFGEKTGEYNALGLPLRRDWADAYRGMPLIVYGHTPTPEPVFRNNTINIDQGCAFGGRLTALRYPELETVSVPAQRVYARPSMAEQIALLTNAALAADD